LIILDNILFRLMASLTPYSLTIYVAWNVALRPEPERPVSKRRFMLMGAVNGMVDAVPELRQKQGKSGQL
jgi:hypothetical protein